MVVLLVGSLLACGQPVSTPSPSSLTAAGSTSMAPLVEELAQAYHAQSPEVSLEVAGLGSQFGLDALERGEADLAMVSWLVTDPASGNSGAWTLRPDWEAVAVARDGIAVIVHPANSIDGVGLLQLRELFSGRAEDWDGAGASVALGPVQTISREDGSGTRAAFTSLVMEGRQLTPAAIVLPSSQAVVDYVAAHPGAIGYVSMDYISSNVKVLRVEGELPTPLTTGQGSYPLTRDLWLVTRKGAEGKVRDLVDFVATPAGQQIVARRFGTIR